MTIFGNFIEKNVKFWAIFLTVKWQFSGGSVCKQTHARHMEISISKHHCGYSQHSGIVWIVLVTNCYVFRTQYSIHSNVLNITQIRMSNLPSKLGQICPKWEKSGTF